MNVDKDLLENHLKNLVNSCFKIVARTQVLGKFSRGLDDRAAIQYSEIKRNNISLKKSTEHIHSIVNLAKRCSDSSDAMTQSIGGGTKKVGDLNTSFQKIDTIFREFSGAIKSLEGVPMMAENVSKVADQARMLAFNARIEAGRAGEDGKGFEVVANEMAELSKQSRCLGDDLAKITHQSVDVICNNFVGISQIISNLTDLSGDISRDFNSLKESADDLKIYSSDLFDNCRGQESVGLSISKSIQELLLLANESSREAGDCVNSTQEMNSDVEQLDKIISDIVGVVTGTQVKDISPVDALNCLDDFTIVDVRRPEEYCDELGHIQGSMLITIDDHFSEKISQLPRNDTYLFVCRSGGRSARAAQIAMSVGITKIFNLESGMLNWVKNQYPVIGISKE